MKRNRSPPKVQAAAKYTNAKFLMKGKKYDLFRKTERRDRNDKAESFFH